MITYTSVFFDKGLTLSTTRIHVLLNLRDFYSSKNHTNEASSFIPVYKDSKTVKWIQGWP